MVLWVVRVDYYLSRMRKERSGNKRGLRCGFGDKRQHGEASAEALWARADAAIGFGWRRQGGELMLTARRVGERKVKCVIKTGMSAKHG